MGSPTGQSPSNLVESERENEVSTYCDLSNANLKDLSAVELHISLNTTFINVSGNQLRSLKGLPPVFTLTEFDASHNDLVEVSQLIPFPKLAKLNLSHNKVVRITSAIPETVRYLDLSYNNIYTVDLITPILSLSFLECLDLRGNPLAAKGELRGLLVHFPLLKILNGKEISYTSDTTEDLTISKLSAHDTTHVVDKPTKNSVKAARKNPSHIIVNEQIILFTKHGSVSQSSNPVTEPVVAVGTLGVGPGKAPVVSVLSTASAKQQQQLIDESTMVSPRLLRVDAEIQTTLSYKEVRKRTANDPLDEEIDTNLELSQSEATEMRRLQWIKRLIKSNEEVVNSSYMHTMQTELQSYKIEIEELRQQVVALEEHNQQLQSAIKPIETVPLADEQEILQKNGMEEVDFLRKHVKILDEIINRQEASAAVQFPVPADVPEYLSILTSYRHKLFHALLDIKRLEKSNTKEDTSTEINIDTLQNSLLEKQAEITRLTEEKDALREDFSNACKKLTMTEHAAQAFHDKITCYSKVMINVHAYLSALSSTSVELLDKQLAARIRTYLNISLTTPLSPEDINRYIYAASSMIVYRIRDQCVAVETLVERIQDIVSSYHILKDECKELRLKLAALTLERDGLQDDNLLLKDLMRQSKEEQQRLLELKASGILDKAVSCTAVELGDIVHGSTQTYSTGICSHADMQTNLYDFMASKSVQFIPNLLWADNETQTGNLQEMTAQNDILLGEASNFTEPIKDRCQSLRLSMEMSVLDSEEEPDEEYQLLLQMKDVYDRSKAINCTIIPSSVLLKLGIGAEGEDTPEATLDSVLRRLRIGQLYDLMPESDTTDGATKRNKKDRVHIGIQPDSTCLVFKAIQCDILQDPRNNSVSFLNDVHGSSIHSDRSEGGVVVAVASTQADTPDMKYLGVQTDDVDVAPLGTFASLRSYEPVYMDQLAKEVDTKTLGIQSDEIRLAYKAIQCSSEVGEANAWISIQESEGTAETDEAQKIGVFTPERIVCVEECCVDESLQTCNDIEQEHAEHGKVDESTLLKYNSIEELLSALIDSTTVALDRQSVLRFLSIALKEIQKKSLDINNDQKREMGIQPDQLDDSVEISRLISPPLSPYICSAVYEQDCNRISRQLYQKCQELTRCKLELKDTTDVVTGFIRTISSAENKVSEYKRRLKEDQQTINDLQDTVTQLKENLTCAEAMEKEHRARVQLLENLLNEGKDRSCTTMGLQTRINMMDMRLLLAQMRVATSTVSTQYDPCLSEVSKQILTRGVDAGAEAFPQRARTCSNDNSPINKATRILPFKPAIVPLTPPFPTPPSANSTYAPDALRKSLRNSPIITMRYSDDRNTDEENRLTINIFHPASEAINEPLGISPLISRNRKYASKGHETQAIFMVNHRCRANPTIHSN